MLQTRASDLDANTFITEEERLKEQYTKLGYVIVRGFFSKDEMHRLIEEIKAAKTRNGVSGLNKGHMTFYSNVFFHSKPLQDFIAQPRLIDLLKRLIGPHFWVRWDQARLRALGLATSAGTKTTAIADFTMLTIRCGSH